MTNNNDTIETLIGTSQTMHNAFLRLTNVKLDISQLEKGFEVIQARNEFAIIRSNANNPGTIMLHPYGTNIAYYII